MAFESIPFGKAAGQNAMGIPVAFCNAIAFDLADVKRLVYVSGQLSDLPEKSVEPIALNAGVPVRTL